MYLEDTKVINTIRVLSSEMIQKANSGHPGIALGAAPIAYTLWSKFLKFSTKNTNWNNRDRFVLSAGHGSALLYSLLHIFDYGDLTIQDLKNFRTLGSKTPGHPEFGHTKGVEVTTGPLGQGIANAVGMAMAEVHLASKFNKENYPIVDHYTYVLCGDGCLMEGISYEAASIAGNLGLGKLILLYDSNNITIEGSTENTFKENVLERFKAMNWHTQFIQDGNDLKALEDAINNAKNVNDKPSIIEIKTIIGYGSPNKQGTASSHGEPLGQAELLELKKFLNMPEQEFFVSDEVKEHLKPIKNEKDLYEISWNELLNKYKQEYPDLHQEYINWHSDFNELNFEEKVYNCEGYWDNNEDMPTRQSSEIMLNRVTNLIPNLFGGSADLAPSNKSIMKGKGTFSKENPSGANIQFGVREHAMTAIANGIYLHGGLRPYIAGFFVFSDYMKPSLRLSSLMNLPIISIFTHDSIGVGEDGCTHQPIEQLAALRSIPNHTVIRPCDTNETAAAWYLAITRKTSPTSLIFTRQITKALGDGKKALKGAYIIKEAYNETPDIILIASGSEVSIACDAGEILEKKGISTRVVSMPSFEIFEEQTDEYKNYILPKNVTKRISIEASCDFGWYKYVGLDGEVISVNQFGESAPFNQLFEKYGFTSENIVNKALDILKK